MKRSKKLLALMMAMVMAFSLMAVTAAAAGTEEHEHECAVCCENDGIMPLVQLGACPYCNGNAEYDVRPNGIRFTCLNRDICGKSGWL